MLLIHHVHCKWMQNTRTLHKFLLLRNLNVAEVIAILSQKLEWIDGSRSYHQ